jgi:hypothetical protein
MRFYASGECRALTAYTQGVRQARKQIAALLFVAMVIVLLVSVLTTHGVEQHGFELFFFALIPLFLFGMVALSEIVPFWLSASYLPLKPLFVWPLLFQLPPPSDNY